MLCRSKNIRMLDSMDDCSQSKLVYSNKFFAMAFLYNQQDQDLAIQQ